MRGCGVKGVAMARGAGFSLPELLVVLGITGILALLAYPSFQGSLRKARRADALAAAMELQLAQEKLRSSCPFYAQQLGAASHCGASAAQTVVQAASLSREGYYRLSIQAGSASAQAYTAVLEAQGLQAADTDCSHLLLVRSAEQPVPARLPSACW